MAGTVLHVLLRCKKHIDKRFSEVEDKRRTLLHKAFTSNKEIRDFKRFLKMVILEWDCGKEIYDNLNWTEDEFRKLKEIKRNRSQQLTVGRKEKKGELIPL